MPPPILSLCIPTFNRAHYLDACLDSLSLTSTELWKEVELVISDNASTDYSEEVVRKYQQKYPIRYFRNETNIGGERNFFAAATRAISEHVWVFGDDDVFGDDAIAKILPHLRAGSDLVIVNYSSWSKEMDAQLKPHSLPWTADKTFTNREDVLRTFGTHLGYISSLIVRRNILLSAPADEREKYVPYCFPHMYSIYRGLPSACRVIYLGSPVFRRREFNCEGFAGSGTESAWLKCFIEGSALIFEALEGSGYSRKVVKQVKDHTLKNFGIGNVLAGIHNVDRAALLRFMYRHYARSQKFWGQWFPLLLLPAAISEGIYSLYRGVLRPAVATEESGAR